METILDAPVSSIQIKEALGRSAFGGQARDSHNRFALEFRAAIALASKSSPPQGEDLTDVREVHFVVDLTADPELSRFGAPVSFLGRLDLRGENTPSGVLRSPP